MLINQLIFFVYPGSASWRRAKNRRHEVEELDEVKINLLPLGMG
jgi:hypothetical protein